jgi:adenylosuccinate lyase
MCVYAYTTFVFNLCMHVCLDDKLFSAVHDQLDQLLDPRRFVGRAPEQVTEFLRDCIDPVLETHAQALLSTTLDSVNV